MAEIFLTQDEIEALSGYRKASAQCRWLAEQGIDFIVRADGRPVVSRLAIEQRLGAVSAQEERPIEPEWDNVA